MCKHVAAVLYGIGARLDHQPELLFTLRKVDQQDLIAKAGSDLVEEAESTGRREGARERRPLGDVRHRDGAVDAGEAERLQRGRPATVHRRHVGRAVAAGAFDSAGETEGARPRTAHRHQAADSGEAPSDL